jgi:hypothetical protein
MQSRGLIKFIADKLLQEVENQKIPFTYGFPNENAYDLHLKLLKYEDISMQVSIEKRMSSSSKVTLNNFSSELEFRKIDRFDESLNALWEEAKEHFKVILIRSKGFLNWRYIERPDAIYYPFGAYDSGKLVGYCILKLYQENNILRGHFLDLFTVPNKRTYGCFLVQKGLEFFAEKKVDSVNLWMQGSPFFLDILSEYGFIEGSSRPMICRFNVDQVKFKPIMTEDNWYFTMGDTLEVY